MGHPIKVVTCCYCGARAALVLAKDGRHELSCAQCAAPLRHLKMIPRPPQTRTHPSPKQNPPMRSKGSLNTYPKNSKKQGRREKYAPPSLWKLAKKRFEKIEDIVEDLFDDIFD